MRSGVSASPGRALAVVVHRVRVLVVVELLSRICRRARSEVLPEPVEVHVVRLVFEFAGDFRLLGFRPASPHGVTPRRSPRGPAPVSQSVLLATLPRDATPSRLAAVTCGEPGAMSLTKTVASQWPLRRA